MRVLLQRVTYGAVAVEGQTIAEIHHGVVLLVGVGQGDDAAAAAWLAEKIAHLRIFEDDAGKMNRSLLNVQGEALAVSQFTLYADTQKGRRPAFTAAALPDIAEPLITRFAANLRDLGVPTQTGQFGAHMQVTIHNDGPVTLWLER